MKSIYKYNKIILLMAVIILGLGSCSSDDFASPNENNIPLIADYENDFKIEVDQTTNYVTFTFTGKGVMPVWIINGTSYSSSFTMKKYYRKAGDYTVDLKVANANGTSDGTITKTFHIDKTIMSGFGGYVYNSNFNLWKKATISKPVFYYAPGWSQIADPSYTLNDSIYTIGLPKATAEVWQAQVKLGSNINTSVGTKYDFSVILSSNTNNSHVTVKLVDGTSDDIFYFAEIVELSADEPYCFWKSGMEGIDITNLRLVLDFGGNANNTDVTIENIVFKDHANDDGTILPEVKPDVDVPWVDVDSSDNLWHGVKFKNEFYYAPGWNALPEPAFTIDGSTYSLVFTKATFEQWQNQVKFLSESLSITAKENYDFRVTLNATNDINQATIKLVEQGGGENDNIYIFTERIDLKAGTNVVLKLANQPGIDISKVMLVFDFGGNPDNTNISIKDVILQKHKD